MALFFKIKIQYFEFYDFLTLESGLPVNLETHANDYFVERIISEGCRCVNGVRVAGYGRMSSTANGDVLGIGQF